MVRAGVPAGVVIEEQCSLSTYENAIFSAAILARLGAEKAIVVTCPWHLPRALGRTFARPGSTPSRSRPAKALPGSRQRRASTWRRTSVCAASSTPRRCAGPTCSCESAARFASSGRSPPTGVAARPEVDA